MSFNELLRWGCRNTDLSVFAVVAVVDVELFARFDNKKSNESFSLGVHSTFEYAEKRLYCNEK